MNVSSLLSWLFQSQEKGISLGLERMAALLAALGNPEKRCPVFHIAGTNGKGSVAAFSASLLCAAGCRTGLYTSPHLIDFKERLQINGKMISEDALGEGIKRLQVATAGWSRLPTFFELTTALAFDFFARSECDVVVLETGLGGRLDATNLAANKIACAITPISLDHTEWLGPTLSSIAQEKAGIICSGVPVVTSPQSEEVMIVLKKEAARMGAPLIIANEPVALDRPLGLVGSYQRWNAALALALVKKGPWVISKEAEEQALTSVSWPGRFQCFQICTHEISQGDGRLTLNCQRFTPNRNSLPSLLEKGASLLILDGAHNLGAVEQLVKTWKEEFSDERCTLIFGALADKEAEEMLHMLEPLAASIFLVPVASSRSISPENLRAKSAKVTLFSSLEEALKKIMPSNKKSSQQQNLPSRPILLTGSLFLVGEALSLLERKLYHSSKQ